jgi:hypothetical protein
MIFKEHYDIHASALVATASGLVIVPTVDNHLTAIMYGIIPGLIVFAITTIIKMVFRFKEKGL